MKNEMFKKIWCGGHKCSYKFKKFGYNRSKFLSKNSKMSKLKTDILYNRMGKMPRKKEYFFVLAKLGKV